MLASATAATTAGRSVMGALWGAALVEPTPFGEAAVGALTLGLLLNTMASSDGRAGPPQVERLEPGEPLFVAGTERRLVQVADDMIVVVNAEPGIHRFAIRGADGLWSAPESSLTGTTNPDGTLNADWAALEEAYGRPLPDSILPTARPAGLDRYPNLQTTPAGVAAAMADSDDPCRHLPGENHHILPAGVMWPNQAFLDSIGFRLDSSENLIRLPADDRQRDVMSEMCGESRSTHRGRHPKAYENAINRHLQQIGEDFSAGRISQQEAVARVQTLQAEITAALSAGRFERVNSLEVARHIARLQL